MRLEWCQLSRMSLSLWLSRLNRCSLLPRMSPCGCLSGCLGCRLAVLCLSVSRLSRVCLFNCFVLVSLVVSADPVSLVVSTGSILSLWLSLGCLVVRPIPLSRLSTWPATADGRRMLIGLVDPNGSQWSERLQDGHRTVTGGSEGGQRVVRARVRQMTGRRRLKVVEGQLEPASKTLASVGHH